jgi:uncharacterized protein (DUF1330 family)
MAMTVVLHRVADYDAWRQVYDSVRDLQKSAGVMAESVHRMAGDADNVMVLHEFDTLDHAQAFFADPELAQAMQRGGVQGRPRIEFYE